MKYAKFSDDFLSYFRLDDNGETLVLTDKRGYTRAVELLPYEERPQGDLISREALKKAFEETIVIEPMPYAFVKQLIDNAPTVECVALTEEAYSDLCLRASRETPKGEWKLDSLGAYCSECGTHPDYSSNYCPNCGADMRKGEI